MTRAYINVFGTINKFLSVRVTPDVVTSDVGQTFRLKYAYAQVNLDDWLGKGAWLRGGVTQTPLVDYEENIYRYRFQGPIFVDREGFLTSSDSGGSFHMNLPHDLGDVHAGVYNGEGYSHSEVPKDATKAFQLRASICPAHGLRVTGFVDDDTVQRGLDRKRTVGQVTFEHPRVVAGVDWLHARDQKTPAAALMRARGYSAWLEPNFTKQWGALLRYDRLRPDTNTSQVKRRDIEGLAYWFPMPKGAAGALMLDRDALRTSGAASVINYGLKTMLSF